MANQCYFNGNFYQCVTATSAGESPATAPAKWSLVQIPARWRWLLVRLTYSHLLELDGQTDKSMEQRQLVIDDERRGLDQAIRVEANKEAFLARPHVRMSNQF